MKRLFYKKKLGEYLHCLLLYIIILKGSYCRTALKNSFVKSKGAQICEVFYHKKLLKLAIPLASTKSYSNKYYKLALEKSNTRPTNYFPPNGAIFLFAVIAKD